MTTPISDDEIHGYVDRQLSPERRAAVERALVDDAPLASKVREIERQNAWLREGLDPLLAEPLPRQLIDAARMPRRPRRIGRFVAVAASVATLCVGFLGGWYVRDAELEIAGTPTTFARQAAFTHPTSTGPSKSGRRRKSGSSRGSRSASTIRCTRPI